MLSLLLIFDVILSVIFSDWFLACSLPHKCPVGPIGCAAATRGIVRLGSALAARKEHDLSEQE